MYAVWGKCHINRKVVAPALIVRTKTMAFFLN